MRPMREKSKSRAYSCTKSLAHGRYRWRHDHVLEAIARGLDKACKRTAAKKQKPGFINFVKTTTPGTQQNKEQLTKALMDYWEWPAIGLYRQT